MDVLHIKYMNDDCTVDCVPIPGFHGYYISSNGKVISKKSGTEKTMSPRIKKDNYMDIGLYIGRIRYFKLVHRLVAEGFLPNYSEELQVDHEDGDRQNNNLNNLRMATDDLNRRNRHEYLQGILLNTKRCVRCHWTDDNHNIHTKAFSVNIYGFAFAFLMASNIREEMVKLYYNRPE